MSFLNPFSPSDTATAEDAVASIDAITKYMQEARSEIPAHPEVERIINDYGKWRRELSWFKLNMDSLTALSEAKYYRDKLNEITQRQVPVDWVPADAEQASLSTAVKVDPTPKTPLIPTSYKVAAAAGVSAVVTLVILKKLRII
jgi:hypothetical protein